MRPEGSSKSSDAPTQAEIDNNLIDELVAGELDRQEFLRRAAVFGLGAGTIGMLLALHRRAEPAFGAPLAPAKVGGTLRVGTVAYRLGASSRISCREAGSLGLAGIPGEYLTWTNPKLEVKPWLATSWKPNKDLTVWTFQLRKNVKFHNGKTMNADDVVASIRQYITLKDSQALWCASRQHDRAVGCGEDGPYTVQFRLKQANNRSHTSSARRRTRRSSSRRRSRPSRAHGCRAA